MRTIHQNANARCAWVVLSLLAVSAVSACKGGGSSSSGDNGSSSSSGGSSSTGGPQAGEVGAPCTRNADCDSQLCLASGRCTKACSTVSDCPGAWSCDAVPGAGTICSCTLSGTVDICDGRDNDCDARLDNGAMCETGKTCTAGACSCPAENNCGGTCTDTHTDSANCGSCGHACGTMEVCSNGSCVTDCGALSQCSGACVNEQTDNNHCGSCTAVCGNGKTCQGAQCQCPSGTTDCNGTCVNTTIDNNNCNTCGNSCGAGKVCVNSACQCAPPTESCGGTCVNTQADNSNCNTCGHACTNGDVCVTGQCSQNCSGTQTRCGTSCVDTTHDSANCNGCGMACGAGSVCINSQCGVAPKNIGGPCTHDADCGAGGQCRPAAQGWAGGYCYYPGDYCNQQPTPCPDANEMCSEHVYLVPGPDISHITATMCLKRCASAADCRQGYACIKPYPDGDGVCQPDCNTNPSLICGSGVCQPNGDCNDYCSTTTGQGCSAAGECNGGYCACIMNSTYGAGAVCQYESGLVGCSDDSFCGPGHTCNTTSHFCQ